MQLQRSNDRPAAGALNEADGFNSHRWVRFHDLKRMSLTLGTSRLCHGEAPELGMGNNVEPGLGVV